MGTLTFAKRTCAAIAFTCALLTLTGCGSGESEAVAQDPQVDPRFATADALLREYNRITTQNPVDLRAAYDLCYSENDLQRRYIEASKRMVPMADLDFVLFEKFGEGWIAKQKQPMLAPDQPAEMTKVEHARAEAKFVNSEGKLKKLLLVKVGDRWWVSGYTIEYDDDIDTQAALREIEQYEHLINDFADAAPSVTAQVRNGTITSAQEARRTLARSVIKIIPPQ